MADFQPAASGKGRRKLTTPRIDLTPMVDLGFLLITFFMYTTTLALPKLMEITAPPKAAPGTPIPAEATLVIIPTSGRHIAFYPGTEQASPNLQWCKGPNGLRRLLEQESSRVKALPPSFSAKAHKLHVLIKPDTSAAYDNVVNVLDEMNIASVPSYALMRISPQEQEALKKIQAKAYGK